MNQYFKTFKPSPFAYFLVTLIISYLLWALLPAETQTYAVDFCECWWKFLTDPVVWEGWWKFLTDPVVWEGWWNSLWTEYSKLVTNNSYDPTIHTLP